MSDVSKLQITRTSRGEYLAAVSWASPRRVTVDYFCYISRTKVDQLYHALTPEAADEWIEQESSEHKVDSSLNADLSLARIFSIFKGGISYGRKGFVQRERKIKLEYVEKLRRVLIAIAREAPVPALSSVLGTGQFGSLYYHHEGSFIVKEAITEPDSRSVVTLQTKVEGETLLLDCSLRFFSDGNEPDGSFTLNSSNSRFFAGKIPLQMESVFVVLHQGSGEIVGTPLYLKLAETDQTGL